MVSLPVLPADCCLNKLFPCCHKEVSNASTEEGNKKAKIELCPCKKRITKLVKTLKENEKDQELTGKIGKGITVLCPCTKKVAKIAKSFQKTEKSNDKQKVLPEKSGKEEESSEGFTNVNFENKAVENHYEICPGA